MLAAEYDLTCEQGIDFRCQVFYLDSTETAVDLAGYTARMYVKRSTRTANTIATLTTENGGIALNATTGQVDLFLPDNVTETLPAGDFLYDLELQDGSGGSPVRLLKGSFTVTAEVTW